MKPPVFDYVAPSTLEEALARIADGDGDARPLAGGQSLLPLLNFRLASPGVLVDLGRIEQLLHTTIDGAAVTVGAMTPSARLVRGDVAAAAPPLAAAARLVGHPQIRSRGTVGGSIAHADPAAELPAVALLLGATIELAGPRGRRQVEAEAFFDGVFETVCSWDELVTAVRFPRLESGTGWGFQEFARRPGDFALAGVGVTARTQDGIVEGARVVAFGVGPTPVRVRGAERVLEGMAPTDALLTQAGDALAAEIDPSDMLHGSGSYRRRVTAALLRRAMDDALSAPVAGAIA